MIRQMSWREVDEHRRDRADLDHRRVAGDRRVVHVQPEQLSEIGQVGGAGDRQELGQPLDHTEHHGVAVVHVGAAYEVVRAASRCPAGCGRAATVCLMQQRSLGRSGLSVSRLGLGMMTWGSETDEHEAREQLTAFLDAGGTLLDTAHTYAGGRVRGAARQVARRGGPARRGGRRDQGRRRHAPRCAGDGHLSRLPAELPRPVAATAGRRPRGPLAGARLVRQGADRGDPLGAGHRGARPAGRRTSASRTSPAGGPRRPRPGSAPCRAGHRWSRPRWSTRC